MVSAQCIQGCREASTASSHTMVLIPEMAVASLARKRCPSHFSFNSFGLTSTSTSRYLGSGLSGNNMSMLSSCSIPVSQIISEFCLKRYNWSALVGSSSLLLKIAMDCLSIFSTKRWRFSTKISGFKGRYFIDYFLAVAIYI